MEIPAGNLNNFLPFRAARCQDYGLEKTGTGAAVCAAGSQGIDGFFKNEHPALLYSLQPVP
jgi:hypothetical protein